MYRRGPKYKSATDLRTDKRIENQLSKFMYSSSKPYLRKMKIARKQSERLHIHNDNSPSPVHGSQTAMNKTKHADRSNDSPSPVHGSQTAMNKTKHADRSDDESMWSDSSNDSGIVTINSFGTIQGRTTSDLDEAIKNELRRQLQDELDEAENPRVRRRIREKEKYSSIKGEGIRTKKRKGKSKKKKSKKKKSKKKKSKKKGKSKKKRKTSYKKRRTRSK